MRLMYTCTYRNVSDLLAYPLKSYPAEKTIMGIFRRVLFKFRAHNWEFNIQRFYPILPEFQPGWVHLTAGVERKTRALLSTTVQCFTLGTN